MLHAQFHAVIIYWSLLVASAAGQQGLSISQLIEAARPAIVGLLQESVAGRLSVSSGSLIHQRGFVLTTDLPIRGRPGLAMVEGIGLVPYQVVGRLPEKDIALLLLDADRPLVCLTPGQSRSILAGQQVLVAGNPGACGVSFAQAMVGCPSVAARTEDALDVLGYRAERMDRYIRLDKRVTGMVGGPLLDMDGRVVGLVTSKVTTEEGVSLAIPIDSVRTWFYELVGAEERGGFWTGCEVDMMGPEALVLSVEQDGVAAKAGLLQGDKIVSVYGRPIRDGLDWLLALTWRKPGEAVVLVSVRGGSRKECTITLGPYPTKSIAPTDQLEEGLWYAVFRGDFEVLPDPSDLEPVAFGIVPDLQLDGLEGVGEDGFAVIFDGFMEVPRLGVYRIALGSDDGSRLYLDGSVVVDNDGIHPYQEACGLRRLSAGLHHLRIDYFHATGRPQISLRIEPDNISGDQPPVSVRLLCQ